MHTFKGLFQICLIIFFFQVISNDTTIGMPKTFELNNRLQSSTEGNIGFADFLYKSKKTKTKTNGKLATYQSIPSQFENSCITNQPCTCYYPDHPNVTKFELSNDAATQNASGVNGTGPGHCEDLQDLGHTLMGFYMVRFDSKRIKTVYCEFNDTKPNKNSKTKRIKRTPKPKVLRFCGGVGHEPCTFYYSDNPDAPLTSFKSKKFTNNINNQVGPKSCDDLDRIGHFLKGFYMVRFNAIKLKTVYCEFNKTNLKDSKNKWKNILPKLDKNATGAISKVSRFCQGVGSQPCSCYYTNYPNILQYELSSDEITRNASSVNGPGPESCDDLKKTGHFLDGFDMVRYRDKIMKTVFCQFNEKKKDFKLAGRPKKPKRVDKTKDWFPGATLLQTISTPIMDEEEATTKILTTQTPLTTRKQNPKLKSPGISVSINGKSISHGVSNCGKDCYSFVFDFGANGRRRRRDHSNYNGSYLLKNEYGKCLGVSNVTINKNKNIARIIQSNCSPLEKGQLWKPSKNHICNERNKCLSLPIEWSPDNLTLGIIQNDYDTDSPLQKWSFRMPGFIVNLNHCLEADGYEIKMSKCNGVQKGQSWYFENI